MDEVLILSVLVVWTAVALLSSIAVRFAEHGEREELIAGWLFFVAVLAAIFMTHHLVLVFQAR